MADLRVFSLNVRGLRNSSKRKKVFRMLKEKKYDVICLQETYITEDVTEQWKKEWAGEIIFCQGTRNSRGQVILIRSNFPHTWSIELISDRILIVKVLLGNRETAIVNVYAPCNIPATKLFITNLIDTVNDLDCEEKVVCGDFNAVMNNRLDIISGDKHHEALVNSFNDFVEKCDLIDAWRSCNPHTSEFTWSRVSQGKLTARRLDYVLLSDSAHNNLSETDICSVSSSDHRGVFVSIRNTDIARGPGYWKLNNSLLKNKMYIDNINQLIDMFKLETTEENAEVRWELLKMKIKNETVQFSKTLAVKRRNNIIEVQNDLNMCESSLAIAPTDVKLIQQREALKFQLDLYEQDKLKSAQIRSKERWIQEGDKNTKYFLGLEKSRANSKLFSSLELDNGETVNGQFEILQEQRKYYESIYSTKKTHSQELTDVFLQGCNIPTITEEERKACEGIINVDEASAALKMMKNGSSPGLDGLTTEFYKMFWVKIKDVVVQSYNVSFKKGHLSHTQSSAVITLIHKGKDLPKNKLANWRPISLTNTDYKILAKCISNRLSLVIDSIVHTDQVGYIKGRNVSTTIRTIDDIIELYRLKEKPGILLALDFHRAFDSINKKYMLYAFKKFGFGRNFLQWVDVLFDQSRSCIGYNGWLSSDFSLNCGIRQGCPFSPLAFVIGVELLAIRMRQDVKLKGLEVGVDKIVKVLLYADDITMFLKDKDDVKYILLILEEFKEFAGLEINTQKSEVMVIGLRRNENWADIGLKVVDTIKILGVHFSNSKCASDIDMNWKDKLKKIRQLICRWERRNLGLLGKVCVIKSLLLSQCVYLLQAICLPEIVLTEINTLLYRFLWRKRDCNKKAFEKVKRVVVNSDIGQGGLKMIDVKTMQASFLCQWMIKLSNVEVEETWKCIPRSYFNIFGENCACFNTTMGPKKFKGIELLTSMFWRQVAQTWLHYNRTPHKGSPRMECLWNNENIVYQNQVIHFPNWAKKGITYVNDLLDDQNGIKSFEIVKTTLGTSPSLYLEYFTVHSALIKYLKRNPTYTDSCTELPTRLIFNNENITTAKLIRLFIVETKFTTPCSVQFWKNKFDYEINELHWNIVTEIKESRLRELHWKILHNTYPTNILLKKMGLSNTEMCSYCAQERDFIEHFFFDCKMVKPLWKHVQELICAKTGLLLTLEAKCVLLGIVCLENVSKNDIAMINYLILIAKMCISKFKYGTPVNIIIMFESELHIRKIDMGCT